MTTKSLEQEKKNNIYLLYGEETYSLEMTLKKKKNQFKELILGINYIVINEDNINTLIQEINTPAFGYDKKLILVKANLLKKTKQNITEKSKTKNENKTAQEISKYIKEHIKEFKETVELIFIEETVEKKELYKTIEELGMIFNFERLRPTELAQKLKSICKAYEVNIDNESMQYFIETCGTNMQNLINEIRKLIEYIGKGGTIKKEDIEKLSIKDFQSVIFELTDNLGKKNIKKALDILHELLYNKEPIQKILITLYNHFKKIYIVILAKEYNKDASKSLNLKPNQMFLITKYKKQSEYFTKEELRKILKELINLDYNSKQGLIDLNIGLEAILATYCS